jgi:hypothetical protein
LTDHDTNIRTGDTLYGSVAERISEGIDLNKRNIGAFNMNNINIAFSKQNSKRKLQEFQEEFQWLFNSTTELHGRGRERTSGEDKQSTGKRKCFQDDIDLSLSLSCIRSRQEEDHKRIPWIEEEVDSNLSLSCSSSSKKGDYSIDLNLPSKVSRLSTEDYNAENPKLASTLDLTI